MSLPLWISTDPWVHALGLALMHGIWQGVAIAGVAAVALRATHPRAATRRHAILLAALLAQFVLFAATVGLVHDGRVAASVSPTNPATWPAPAPTSRSGIAEGVAGGVNAAFKGARPLFPWVVVVWAAGTALLGARIVFGVRSVARLRDTADPTGFALEERARRLAERIGLRRGFRVLASGEIDTPVAVGWRDPAVLFPEGVLDRLDGEEIDALLLHELAHLKGRDDVVVVLEAAVRAVSFHHPCTWWLTRRSTLEREHRCDDLVAEFSGELSSYVRALVGLEELRGASVASGLHAATCSLLERVRRLVEPPVGPSRRRTVGGIAVGAMIVAAASLVQLVAVPAVPATPPGWGTIRAVDDAGRFTVVFGAGRVRAVAMEGEALAPARFAHERDSLYVLDASGAPRFAVRVRPEGGLEWTSRPPGWRLDGGLP